jgi:signal transduction histidine kinase
MECQGDSFSQPGGPEPISVLLVEDNPADAYMIRLLLEEAQGAMELAHGIFCVEHVDRREEALRRLRQDRFGIVLLDLRLPDAQGLESLEQIQAIDPNLPIIVLTGLDDDGLALTAIKYGAQDYLEKEDLEGRLLRRTLRHARQRKQAERQLRRHAREVEAARQRIEQQADQLKERAEQLARINRELDDFTYIASHDLKEPLRGIEAYCELLCEDFGEKLGDEGQARLDSLTQMCQRSIKLIDNLLTYSRVGQVEPNSSVLDLNAVVGQILSDLGPTLKQRHAEVRTQGDLPAVKGDETLIGMLFANLVGNGAKFNQQPTPTIEIGTAPNDDDAWVTLYVRDNGIGIEPKYHDDIFTIFRRLHGRKKYEGTGAGLTIVRKIIQSHGGEIWLDSTPGEGTTFYFTLPGVPPSAESRSVAPSPHWLGLHGPADHGADAGQPASDTSALD